MECALQIFEIRIIRKLREREGFQNILNLKRLDGRFQVIRKEAIKSQSNKTSEDVYT